MVIPSDGGAALVRLPSGKDKRDSTARVVLQEPRNTVGTNATFDHGAMSPDGSRLAVACTCGALHIHSILSNALDDELSHVTIIHSFR